MLFRLKLLNLTNNWISNHIQAVNQAAVSENEKIEKLTVIQKLEETQREFKVTILILAILAQFYVLININISRSFLTRKCWQKRYYYISF